MRGNAGFSIVAELIAAALLLFSVLAIVGITTVGYREFNNYRIQTAIIDQESLIVAALQSEHSLEDLRPVLLNANGSMPWGLPLNLNSVPVAYQGTSWFTYDHTPCTAGSSPDCEFKVALNIQCSNGYCQAGYRISSASAGFAIGGSDDSLPYSDLTVPIPFEITARKGGTLGCDPNTEMFATGYNKKTGELKCVKRPLGIKCGPYQIAQSIVYDKYQNTVVPVCVGLKTAQCLGGYSLQGLQPSSLMPDSGGVNASCVYTGQNPAYYPQPSVSGPSISGTFCPPNYNLTNFSCSMSVQYASNGNNCPWAPDFPYNSGYPTQGYSGQNGSCVVHYPPQGCGATWKAFVSVNPGGYCTLAVPENLPAGG